MFLYKKEHILSPEKCELFIQSFEQSDRKKPGVLYGPEGNTSTSGKRSTDISFVPKDLQDPTWGSLLADLVGILDRELLTYATRFDGGFNQMDPLEISPSFNMQRYLPGEGFSTWHCERAGIKFIKRTLVWMVYLNTVQDRGETQFMYQNTCEQPKEGTLLIWPSDWTYTHRGIPSPTETKYILTGWYDIVEKP